MKKISLVIITLIMLFVVNITPLFAKTKVKVAYPIQQNMTELSDNSVYSGYTYDYLKEVERYSNFEFEFVTFEGDENTQITSAMEKVQNGEIDMIGGMLYDQSLTSIYDYTSTNYGMGNMALYVLSDNANINDTSIYSLDTLDVGVVSSTKKENIKLREFGQTNGIKIIQHIYETSHELLSALDNKEIQAGALSEQGSVIGNYRVVATYSPSPFYFVTTKGKVNIISDMNEAMTSLNKEQPSFMSELHNKYFSLKNYNFLLNDKEKQYVKEHPTIEVAILGGRAPFQFKDSQGNVVGISIDLLDYIGELSGIQFKYHFTESYEDYQNMIEDEQCLITAGVTSSYDNSKYILSKSFVDSNIEIVTEKGLNANEIVGKKVAVPKGKYLFMDYQGEVVYYDTAEECLKAVDRGDVDYSYLASRVAMYYNSAYQFENISMITQSGKANIKNCMAVRYEKDLSLLNIINKGIDAASFSEIQSIIFKNATYAKEDVTFVNYIKKNPAQFISIILVLGSIYLFSRYYTNKKNNEKILKEYDRFQQISDLSGDSFIEYTVAEDQLILSGGGAKLLSLNKNIKHYISMEQPGSQRMKQVLINRRTFDDEVLVELMDGTKRWQRIFLQPIFNEHEEITHIIGKITDIQSQKEEQLQWKELARKDSLTKIYNSATCRELIEDYLMNATTNGLALIILDIDNFKGINDNCGHFYGDQVLQNLASTILQITKSTDIVGRVGGDEFIIALKAPENENVIVEYCEKLRTVVYETLDGEDGNALTLSIGIAFSKEKQTYDELYQEADKALYAVKNSGRDSYQFINTF